MSNNENIPLKITTPGTDAFRERKFYTKPNLEELGDLRTMTLGTSGGSGESGPSDTTHWNGPPETEAPFPF